MEKNKRRRVSVSFSSNDMEPIQLIMNFFKQD